MPDTRGSLDASGITAGAAQARCKERLALSGSAFEAIRRGAVGRCPRCGGSKLFSRFLKPIARCDVCEQDWTPQQADDFPAYVAIFVTGHVLAPLIIALVKGAGLSVGALTAIILLLAIFMTFALLQPAKGAVIAVQWWFSMHGFNRGTHGRD